MQDSVYISLTASMIYVETITAQSPGFVAPIQAETFIVDRLFIGASDTLYDNGEFVTPIWDTLHTLVGESA